MNVFIINAHEVHSFSEGKLNASLVEKAKRQLEAYGHHVNTVSMNDPLDNEEQISHHMWADVVIIQSPVNWMGVSWSFKKYMDEIYTSGIGKLCTGDGRSSEDASKQYGSGGLLQGKKYMFSLTFNAPAEAFGDTSQVFFEGKSVDDLFYPMHLNYKFFGMTPIDTFVCYDVLKNPRIEQDFERFSKHLSQHIQ